MFYALIFTLIFCLADLSLAGPTKLIGKQPLISVDNSGEKVAAPFRPYLNAFGVIKRPGRGVCTATHLGNGYVLTAAHCFLPNSISPYTQVQWDAPCGENKIYWGNRGKNLLTGKPLVSSVSKCVKIIYAERSVVYTRPATDFVIFKVDRAPKAKISISLADRPADGTPITTFSYPQNRSLEWSQYCRVVNSKGVRAPSIFWHECDTEGGSSGSAMLMISQLSGRPVVMGLHNGGENKYDYNYGTFMASARESMRIHGLNLDSELGESEQITSSPVLTKNH